MDKVQRLAEMIREQTIETFKKRFGSNIDVHASSWEVNVIPGKKYTKVDVGRSGKYMIERETIYGIKAYGVINKKKCYGTLDTINEFYWGDYTAVRKH